MLFLQIIEFLSRIFLKAFKNSIINPFRLKDIFPEKEFKSTISAKI